MALARQRLQHALAAAALAILLGAAAFLHFGRSPPETLYVAVLEPEHDAAAEALGRNCKFLQGSGTDPATVDTIRAALAAERDCTVEILNYRKDGTLFYNRFTIRPLFDSSDRLIYYLGIQYDVTEEQRAQQELERLQSTPVD